MERTFVLSSPIADLDKFIAYCMSIEASFAGTTSVTDAAVTAMFSAAIDESAMQAAISAYTDSVSVPRSFLLENQTFPKMTLQAGGDSVFRTVLSSGYSSTNATPMAYVVVDTVSTAPYTVRIVDVPRVAVLGVAAFSNATPAQNWVPIATPPSNPTTLEVQVSASAPVQIASVAFAF
jgi:hypothetical protein